MIAQEVKRKLTAILTADVEGYSRLMGEDKEGTIRTLDTCKEAMSNLIQQQRGRVVDAPGANVLAEFGMWSMLCVVPAALGLSGRTMGTQLIVKDAKITKRYINFLDLFWEGRTS
jgi:hypothetical protein